MKNAVGLKLMCEGKIWIYRNTVLVTDPPSCQRLDAVLPLCHENRFLVEHMNVPDSGTVLDLCTGSGVLALFAAQKARDVVGIDINPRAIEFAKLNSELNALDHKIEWIVGDLFEPVRGRRFDAIVVNPPFVPTQTGDPNYLHSDGGEDGLTIIRKIILQVPEYLDEHGSFQMMAWLSPQFTSVVDRLRTYFGADRVIIRSLFAFPLADYISHQRRARERIRMTGCSKKASDLLHYVYIHVLPTKASFRTHMEVYHIGKAISTSRTVV
jgi:HemK-related putative methylase